MQGRILPLCIVGLDRRHALRMGRTTWSCLCNQSYFAQGTGRALLSVARKEKDFFSKNSDTGYTHARNTQMTYRSGFESASVSEDITNVALDRAVRRRCGACSKSRPMALHSWTKTIEPLPQSHARCTTTRAQRQPLLGCINIFSHRNVLFKPPGQVIDLCLPRSQSSPVRKV